MKKHLLFYSNYYPDPLFGGIERITSRLSDSLIANNFELFYLYTHSSFESGKNQIYISESEILQRKEEIKDYINRNKIDFLVCQHVWSNYSLLGFLRDSTSCKIIFVFHNVPCHEFDWINFRVSLFPLLKSFFATFDFQINVNILKEIVRYTRFKKNWDNEKRTKYLDLYHSCDKYVLLSDSYKKIFKKKGIIIPEHFMSAIPNMLSYDSFASFKSIKEKEKIVLIVSRMQEVQKRISIALKIWKEIEKENNLESWSLQIVGEGPDLDSYKLYARENLKRVSFLGKQEPRKFYENASIFLMTSAYEGWGITLTEAQQFGCVPIVMNTYSAAKDIVTDKENGFLVDYEWMFVRRLKQLMRDGDMRFRMAKNAIESSHRFEKDRVTDMWIDLLKSL